MRHLLTGSGVSILMHMFYLGSITRNVGLYTVQVTCFKMYVYCDMPEPTCNCRFPASTRCPVTVDNEQYATVSIIISVLIVLH